MAGGVPPQMEGRGTHLGRGRGDHDDGVVVEVQRPLDGGQHRDRRAAAVAEVPDR